MLRTPEPKTFLTISPAAAISSGLAPPIMLDKALSLSGIAALWTMVDNKPIDKIWVNFIAMIVCLC